MTQIYIFQHFSFYEQFKCHVADLSMKTAVKESRGLVLFDVSGTGVCYADQAASCQRP